jgi:Ca2+-dependent lipid-binding protein
MVGLVSDDQKQSVAKIRIQAFSLKDLEREHLAAIRASHLLEVRVVQAEDLKRADPLHKTDSLCQVTWGSVTQKTPVVYGSDRPIWNSICRIWADEQSHTSHTLEFTVLGPNAAGASDYIGKASLQARDVFAGIHCHFLLSSFSRAHLH